MLSTSFLNLEKITEARKSMKTRKRNFFQRKQVKPQPLGRKWRKSHKKKSDCKGSAIENGDKSHLRKGHKFLKIERFYFKAKGPRRRVQGLKKMAQRQKCWKWRSGDVRYRAVRRLKTRPQDTRRKIQDTRRKTQDPGLIDGDSTPFQQGSPWQ